MSERKYIVVKLPHKELKKKLDILEKASIKIYCDLISKSDKAICFDIINKDAFSTHGMTKEGDRFVPSWREFVLEILKYYYCEVETGDDKLYLQLLGKKCGAFGDDQYLGGIEYPYFHHDGKIFNFNMYPDGLNMMGKKEISYKGLIDLLNSTIEEKNMKKHEKINVELTPQEVAFLTAFISSGDGSTKDHLHLKGIRFMDDFIDYGKKSLLWKKLDRSLGSPLGLNGGIYNLQQLKPLFQPEIPLFNFKNGLTTKINNNAVSIGCKTKKPQDWIEYCDQIIELDVDKVEIDGYSFTRFEIDGFRSWLKNNFK